MTEQAAAAPRGPNVRIPPPFVFVAGYVVAWLLDRRFEFEIDGAGAGVVQQAVGLLLGLMGFALMAWAVVTFINARTSVLPIRPARQIVTTGPYTFTRNPMYVGLTALYVGLALVTNMAWPLVLLPIVLSALVRFVIRKEEAYLRAAFGGQYDAYCRRVRRWG